MTEEIRGINLQKKDEWREQTKRAGERKREKRRCWPITFFFRAWQRCTHVGSRLVNDARANRWFVNVRCGIGIIRQKGKKKKKLKEGKRSSRAYAGPWFVHRIPLRFKRNRECIKQSSTLPWGEDPTTSSGSARDKRINSIPVLAAFPGHLTGFQRMRFEESGESNAREKREWP